MKRLNFPNFILLCIDILVIALAFQCAYIINYFETSGAFYNETVLPALFIGILPLWLFILSLIKMTGIPPKRNKIMFFLYLQSLIAIFFLLVLFYFVFNLHPVPRMFLAELALIGSMFLFLSRILAHKFFKGLGRKDHIHVNIIIIADDSSIPFIENLITARKVEYRIVVIFSDSDLIKDKYEKTSIILPEKFIGILSNLIEVDFIDEVVNLRDFIDPDKVREVLLSCEETGVTLRLRNDDPKITLSSAIETYIAHGKFLNFINISNDTFAHAIKKTLDVNLAMLMIVVLSPVLLAISILIRLTSRGPLINKLEWIGWRGRLIELYRFRTTIDNPDLKEKDPVYGKENESPVNASEGKFSLTGVGRFLIKSGLDKLPELFNVLKGEMTITGLRHPLQTDKIREIKLN